MTSHQLPPQAFSARAGRIAVSATSALLADADALRAQGRDLLDFGVGEPDFSTPEHIQQAAFEALRQNFTKYTATSGTTELRDAVWQAHARDFFGSRFSRPNVEITAGGKHALFNAMSVLLDPGDEVILPVPFWVSFYDQIRYMGATPVLVPTDPAHGFELSVAAVAAAITPRTKIILLNSPSNPSGAVFPPATIAAVLELCQRHGIWLLSDECYAQLTYDAPPFSAASLPGSEPWLVIAGTLSKSYAMTGWRLGYALAPAPVIQQMISLQSHSTGNTCSFVQRAGVAALLGTQAPVAHMLREFRQRRDVIVAGLRAIPGICCNRPQGAFYAYPDISQLLRSGEAAPDFTRQLLHQAGVVTVPGEVFGSTGHIRLSYATSLPVIEEGLRRLSAFCASRASTGSF